MPKPSFWKALKTGLQSVPEDYKLHFNIFGFGGSMAPRPQLVYRKKPGFRTDKQKKKQKRTQVLFSLEYPLMLLAAPWFSLGKVIHTTVHTYNQQQLETLTHYIWGWYAFSDETAERLAKLLLRWEDMTADDILNDLSDEDRALLPDFFTALENPETDWPVPIIRP
jgi:hypothetical protein